MKYTFTNEEEGLFQQTIIDNPGCLPRRYPNELVVLTGDDIPPTPIPIEE